MDIVCSSKISSISFRLCYKGGGGGGVGWVNCGTGICESANGSTKEKTEAWYGTKSSTLNVELIPKLECKSIIKTLDLTHLKILYGPKLHACSFLGTPS